MDYKIHYVTSSEMSEIKKINLIDKTIFIGEINIKSDIKKLKDYLKTMSEVFQFPIPSKGFNGYNDWMRDLDWLNKNGYVLVIYNFNKFLRLDLISKKEVIDNFTDLIFPFWREEVTRVVVEGKVKPFSVYLVD